MLSKDSSLFSFIALLFSLSLVLGSESTAATLDPISPALTNKLFSTEIKRDKDAGGGNQGHDAFLRNADTFVGSSTPINWGVSGTVYDWELTYDGDTATLDVTGGSPLSYDINPDGTWNAVKIITRSDDDTRFDSAKVTVVVEEANGVALDAPQMFMAELTEYNEVTLELSNGDDLQSLSGTLKWDFQFASGASGSPNSRFAFITKGLEVIPEPATATLVIAGLSMVIRRRR